MSSVDMKFEFSPQAREDFADILQYTIEKWDKDRAYAYRAIIDKAFLTIQRHPHIGRGHAELSPAHRLFPAGRHLIIYRVRDATIYVSRILHERMDIARHS